MGGFGSKGGENMLRDQIQILVDKSEELLLEIEDLQKKLKEKKSNLKIVNDARKKLEILEEQIGE